LNTFIAIYKRYSVSIDIEKFTDYLIGFPKEKNIWKSKDANALIISYKVRPQTKTNDYISDEDSTLTFEGFPLLEHHNFNPNTHLSDLFKSSQKMAHVSLK
jgi:cytochrome oxidase assembly protein ShyY1